MTEECLYVTWRHPRGRIHPVGLLTRLVSEGSEQYRFVYLKAAETFDRFRYLPGLPDLHRVYESEHLFPLFQNRQMPRRRPDYPDYVRKLNLGVDADPFEVMTRNEGRKLTDRIEVFAPPGRNPQGDLTSLFFARGIRHRDGASDAVTGLRPGDRLTLVDQPDNEVNSQAILLDTRDGRPVGWVPDYLVATIHELRTFNTSSTDSTGNAADSGNTHDISAGNTHSGNTHDSGNAAGTGNTHDSGNAVGTGNTVGTGNAADSGNTDSGNTHDISSVVAEHVNPPDVASYMRLICRLTASWPHGYQPFSGPEFQPIVG